jgi:catechol 2,3-dioxygenase-like lactoylglutathione lyase family enzyme
MSFILSLDHVQVAAPPHCEDAARKFFGDLLGMRELEKPDNLQKQGGCWFACGEGGQQLHVGVEGPLFQPAKKAHPAFLIQNYDELHTQLKAAGHTVVDDQQIEGVRRFFSHDPWGNRLEFIAAPQS